MAALTQDQIVAIVSIITSVILGVIVGGSTVAAVILIFLNNLLKSPVLLSSIEKMYGALSPDWQQVIRDLVSVGQIVEGTTGTTMSIPGTTSISMVAGPAAIKETTGGQG